MDSEWLEILQQVKSGRMGVSEAAQRLEDLERGAVGGHASPLAADSEDIQPDLGWWKNGWLVPFWAGTAVFILGALLMGWVYSGSQSIWFACSWLLMLFGMIVLFLGWWSRQARWVHVRVQEASGSRIAISLPLPLRLSAWVLRILAPLIPQIREKNFEHLPGLIDAMADTEGPLSVEVNEEDGQRVRIYII